MKIIDLQSIDTKNTITKQINGRFIPLYKDWDKEKYIVTPEMIYMSACFPGEIKGPHLHKKRHNHFTCIKGEVVFIIEEKEEIDGANKNKIYKEIILNQYSPQILYIEPNESCAHINISLEEAIIINFCSPAWKPDDEDNYPYSYPEYDYTKWVRYIKENKIRKHSKEDCYMETHEVCLCGAEQEENKWNDLVLKKMKEWIDYK